MEEKKDRTNLYLNKELKKEAQIYVINNKKKVKSLTELIEKAIIEYLKKN